MIVAMPKPTVRESASQRVYDWVRGRLLDGTYPGGTLLSEGEVASGVGVSRTPVREAFLQLEAEGMLALYPKRGALVLSVSTAELRDVLAARLLLEPWAAAQVANQPHRSAVAGDLRRLTEEATHAIARGKEVKFQEADRAFHQRMLKAAGNDVLAAFYTTLRDRQIRGGALALRQDPARAGTAMAQHHDIIDAIDNGDPEAAAGAVTSHINDTARALGLHLTTG